VVDDRWLISSGSGSGGGVELLGPGGLLSQVTKALPARALAEELTEPGQPAA
jgi:hypothetical protein